jgi:hypothetical protein
VIGHAGRTAQLSGEAGVQGACPLRAFARFLAVASLSPWHGPPKQCRIKDFDLEELFFNAEIFGVFVSESF